MDDLEEQMEDEAEEAFYREQAREVGMHVARCVAAVIDYYKTDSIRNFDNLEKAFADLSQRLEEVRT